MGVSLEFVYLPADLAGFLFPQSALERLGLSLAAGSVEPGFQGRLSFLIRNSNPIGFVLRPGQLIIRLCLAQLSRASEYSVAPYASGKPPLEMSPDGDEIRNLKAALEPDAPRRVGYPPPDRSLPERLAAVLAADKATKGKLLEQLMEDILGSIDGLQILKRNARLRAEELDLVIKNDLTTGFWRLAGSPIIVECKNWAEKVGAPEISLLLDKLQAIGPDAKTGILVALNGITGDSYADAVLKVREARQRGRYILVLDHHDLQKIADGMSLTHVVEKKYGETILI